LRFELEEPSVKVSQCFFLSLRARQKIFFSVELHLETPGTLGETYLSTAARNRCILARVWNINLRLCPLER
jgi:hypothetical protein